MAQRAKSIISNETDATHAASFKKLPAWCREFIRMNPGSKAIVETEIDNTKDVPVERFRRLFLMHNTNVSVATT